MQELTVARFDKLDALTTNNSIVLNGVNERNELQSEDNQRMNWKVAISKKTGPPKLQMLFQGEKKLFRAVRFIIFKDFYEIIIIIIEKKSDNWSPVAVQLNKTEISNYKMRKRLLPTSSKLSPLFFFVFFDKEMPKDLYITQLVIKTGLFEI